MSAVAETLYKATAAGGQAYAGRGFWKPGVWRSVKPPLRPCSHGIHYCRKEQLVHWLNAELWTFEVADDAETLDAGDKMVCTKGRTLERVAAWNKTTARLFAADCAEAVVHSIPEMHREPFTTAIRVARKYARGECDDKTRAAAWDAAWAAAWAAAWDAARAAAWAAAWDAARAAAWAAAWAAARDAAWDAAGDAAWAAAWAAAGDAARAAQTELLFRYLDGAAGDPE